MSISFANKTVVTKQKSDFSMFPEPPSPKQSTPPLRKESSIKLIDSAVKSESHKEQIEQVDGDDGDDDLERQITE